MRLRNVRRYGEENVELQMTPMIDVVFLLLIFFLLTFQFAAPEGDFNIKMPLAASSLGPPEDVTTLPLTVTLQANSGGELSGMLLNKRPIRNFAELRSEIRNAVMDSAGPGSAAEDTEVELDCPYQLRFEYVIDAMDAVSGYVTPDGRVVRLISKVRFSPPRAP
jgi:biopolymer transport protein ExbD